MQASLLSLPVEIRLSIYDLVFGSPIKAMLSAGRQDVASNTETCLLPASSRLMHPIERSSQLLRVCRTVYLEAHSLLYANTTFHVISQAFAGRLPATFTDGFPAAQHLRNLVWQLDCDLLKHLYLDDLRLAPKSLAGLQNLELRCRSETWRESFLGEWCDREKFVKGREAMLTYAEALREVMSEGLQKVALIEDRAQLGKGRVVLSLRRGPVDLRGEEVLVE